MGKALNITMSKETEQEVMSVVHILHGNTPSNEGSEARGYGVCQENTRKKRKNLSVKVMFSWCEHRSNNVGVAGRHQAHPQGSDADTQQQRKGKAMKALETAN
jgi:hypothetical protein